MKKEKLKSEIVRIHKWKMGWREVLLMDSYVIQKLKSRIFSIMVMKLIIVAAAIRNYLIKYEITETASLPHCTYEICL